MVGEVQPCDISVCIPGTRANTLAKACDSVISQTYQNWELVVVGQGDHATLKSVTDRYSDSGLRVKYVPSNNRGCCRARNMAAQNSSCPIIVFLDDDCEAGPEWLSEIIARFESDPELDVVTGPLLAPPGAYSSLFSTCPQLIVEDAMYDSRLHPFNSPPGFGLIGANFALKKETYNRIGEFDIYLDAGTPFPAAGDIDYLLRLESCGAKICSSSKAVVYHTYGARKGFRNTYRQMRNYARGNGALAAKLTLQGDPRGMEWMKQTWKECWTGWFKTRRPDMIVVGPVRTFHFVKAYCECLSHFTTRSGLLVQKRGPKSPF